MRRSWARATTLTLDDLKQRRPAEVAFRLADLLLRKYFRDEEGGDRPWLFPQLLSFCKRWMAECLTLKDGLSRRCCSLSSRPTTP
jgi:hypothetical protein